MNILITSRNGDKNHSTNENGKIKRVRVQRSK